MEISRLPEFENDLKKLLKKFFTLEEDLAVLAKVLQLTPWPPHWVRISGLGPTNCEIYKVRKFACKSLKGRGANSGIRIVFAYFPEARRVELIEIYFKADKELESRERILGHYKVASPG